jgi:DNA-binding NarL/FixJ family response regulator
VLTILLADDHPLYRRGLHALLDAEPGMTVVGEVDDGIAAVTEAARQAPDVVVMDLHMPRLDGVEATRRIVAAQPRTAVLVVTMHDDDESLFAALRAGALGYLLKGSDAEEIVRGVRAVAAGEAIFGPSIARRVVAWFSAPKPAASAAFPQLTDREREVLDLVAAGRSNTEIAAALDVSAKTVRNHVSNVFAKLHVADRAQAIVQARDAGLGRR